MKNKTGAIPKFVAPTFLQMEPKAISNDNKNEIINITKPIIKVASKSPPPFYSHYTTKLWRELLWLFLEQRYDGNEPM